MLVRLKGYPTTSNVLSMMCITLEPEGLNYKMGSRRIGDIDQIWADVHKAEKDLNWKAELDLKAMLTSAWSWEKRINKQAT
ncbi:unnamed protein product [Adineta steineri]|uniref:UDP-glucose 4-epimerase n=1 Tax=Adineta steineri TaxID=433720 RepID=A0A815RGA3_9BILA|nr:unnamed protein product [Adineta steineri]